MNRRNFLELSSMTAFASMAGGGALAQSRYSHLAGLETPGFWGGRFDGLDDQALVFFTSQQRVDLCAGGFDMIVDAAPRMSSTPIVFVMPEVVQGIPTDNYERIRGLVDANRHVSLLISPDIDEVNRILSGFGRDLYLAAPGNSQEVFVHPQDPYLFHPNVREPSKVYARRLSFNEPALSVDRFVQRVHAAKREQLSQVVGVDADYGINYG